MSSSIFRLIFAFLQRTYALYSLSPFAIPGISLYFPWPFVSIWAGVLS